MAAVIARMGVINGAIIMAPMTVAVESEMMPPEAIMTDRINRTENRTRYGRCHSPSKNSLLSNSGKFSVVKRLALKILDRTSKPFILFILLLFCA